MISRWPPTRARASSSRALAAAPFVARVLIPVLRSIDPALTVEELETIAPELFEAELNGNEERSLRDLSRSVEADQVRASLAAFGGDRDAVCKALGISKTTLWRRLHAKR